MPLVVTNNNQVTLGVALGSSDTTMTVSSIVGLPDVSAPADYTIMTLTSASTGAIEYVRCTDLDTLTRVYTIQRGQEGTIPQTWIVGDLVKNYFTAGMFTELANSASSAMKTASHTIDGTLAVANPAGENSDLLILAKYGNQLIEGTDYNLVDGGDTINFIGGQAVETEVVTFVYTEGVAESTPTFAIEELTATEVDVNKVLRPTGAGGVEWLADNSGLTGRVVVTEASQLATINPTVEYFIDGVVDMGTQTIEVPAGGINIRGFNLGISKLISTQPNYTLFTSPVGGSGNVLDQDITYDVSGTNSSVYALTDASGFSAFEHNRVNWENCTSLGYIDGYRQGLELGTGRFGGTPQLELRGTWIGGYKCTTTIVRSLTDGAYSLFSAGVGFTMSSRFFSDVNADLNTTVSLIDFAPSNFPNPSTLQLQGCEMSRNGTKDAGDTTLLPNVSASDLCSAFRNNSGLPNTFVGGAWNVTSEVATIISSTGVFTDLLGVFTAGGLVHFDSPASGQLRHLGTDPRDFRLTLAVSLEGPANDTVQLRVKRWDDSASTLVDVITQSRPINNLQGGRDFAYFDLIVSTQLDINDYVYAEVANLTTTGNLTAEVGSYMIVESR